MIAFAVGEAENALPQDWITAIPERQCEAKSLLVVADARDTVFAPAIRAAPSMFMAQVVPGVATGAVVLADGAPLAFAQIRCPLAPRRRPGCHFLDSLSFHRENSLSSCVAH